MSRVRVSLLADAMCDPRPRGLARYTRGLCTALLESGEIDLELVAHLSPAAGELPPAPVSRLTASRELVREHVELPRLMSRRQIDVLHAPANRGLPVWAPCPTVVTRHDVIERMFAPGHRGSRRGRLRMLYADAIAMRRSTVVTTVSETSRRDIERQWPGCRGRTLVAGEGVDSRFFDPRVSEATERLRARHQLPRSFILYVGGFEPRKDVATLIAAMAACRVPDVGLVLAGSMGQWRDRILASLATAQIAGRTRVLDFVGDDDLPGLYAAARCFVCPSRYEGFGLPVIEAMATGRPTIVSDGGALPEVAGDAAAVFPAGDAAALTSAIEQVLTDSRLATRLIEHGRRRAEEYRWERVVGRYVSLYRRMSGADAVPPATQPVYA
ncbi:MAG TPA: glycosyltransferase family 1 protein [Candidatus Acidoferrum sp.]|nr:glycosyltransferase family 1 protein [Candidatus Acidoferrum sp.]